MPLVICNNFVSTFLFAPSVRTKFKFRTFNQDGIAVYNKLSSDGYIAVGLKDGTVSLAIKVSSKPLIQIPGGKIRIRL